MRSLYKVVAAGAAAALLSTAAPLPSDLAEAGMPAPLPTQIPIRDINTPPSPGMPAPFVPRPASRKSRRAKTAKRHAAKRPTPAVAATPAPAAAKAPAQSPGLPRLEQRYEPPTETILPLGPGTSPVGGGPAPVIFPPEPAAARAPAKI